MTPSSVTTFVGERAEFHCVAPCNGILWLINNRIAGAAQNIVTGSWTRQRVNGEPGEESTLWITATVHANNSIIECGIEDRSIKFETLSSPAYLIVQGTRYREYKA